MSTPHQNPFNTPSVLGTDGLPAPGTALMSGNLAKTYVGQEVLAYTGRHLPPNLKQLEITCEIYAIGDGTEEQLMIHSACPKCHHAITIKSTEKKVSWERGMRGKDGVARGGKLFVEPFRCTWEMTHDPNDRSDFGVGLCRYRCAYDGRRVKDA